MSLEAPPIVKLCERVLLEIEGAVVNFPRYHKYAVGADLRAQARTVARYAHRAWRDYPRRAQWVNRLAFAVDDLKLTLQLSKRLEAFGSFKQFEALARLASDLGRQCGGWQKQLTKGRNRATETSGGRAQILSARDASCEAN